MSDKTKPFAEDPPVPTPIWARPPRRPRMPLPTREELLASRKEVAGA